jgi:hypothetical protein
MLPCGNEVHRIGRRSSLAVALVHCSGRTRPSLPVACREPYPRACRESKDPACEMRRADLVRSFTKSGCLQSARSGSSRDRVKRTEAAVRPVDKLSSKQGARTVRGLVAARFAYHEHFLRGQRLVLNLDHGTLTNAESPCCARPCRNKTKRIATRPRCSRCRGPACFTSRIGGDGRPGGGAAGKRAAGPGPRVAAALTDGPRRPGAPGRGRCRHHERH